MTTRTALALLLLGACRGEPDGTKPDPEPGDDTGVVDPGPECGELPEAPFPTERIGGFTASEDFVFDAEGHIISIDDAGNLIRQDREGNKTVIVPNVGEAAGMSMLPNGDIVLANVSQGTVDRVTPDGDTSRLTTGIAYPNGLAVDSAGIVYVSEHSAGRIRRIDPETGDYDIIADGLLNPNGLGFSPDEQTLYVNSFGGSTVHALTRQGEGFSAPALHSTIESGPDYDDPCGELAEGDACYLPEAGIGACIAGACTQTPDTAACDGLAEGDACATTFQGEAVDSTCQPGDDGLYCPRIPGPLIAKCEDKNIYDECRPSGPGSYGWCAPTWEGVMACIDYEALWSGAEGACADAAEGDACTVDLHTAPYQATCQPGEEWGFGGLACLGGPLLGEMYGGLDGLDVDACGNVYVTEYVTGVVYRIAEGETEAEPILELDAFWIPNLHWGSGQGGWEADRLYVMNRDDDSIFEVQIGVEGRDLPHMSGE